ncbi:1-acylglycerol-3-phosphate O-acyltransferase Pnpla3-like isoform X2 [Onthophagus taurus]|uniref:1-acylglycerol-3-phosphate O-acyltransferase Pnpla3-like isoform X2 n=1 Tax=Onthophagus taurus TaxID=166361 RepID=UPI000C205918|nr:patatin-like phospholipase domain-containing protein 3 isoform X2 [Onthophagus taurus]
MNLSFAGCGFLGIYHVGVAVCFRKYAPHLLLEKISGASAGALAACSLLCDLPIGDLASDVLRVATEARSRSLGAFHPKFDIQRILLDGLDKILPEDAHLRVNGRLHISLTRVHDGKNIILSHFNSREELMQAINASCFIPLFSGLVPPLVNGVRYIDGGFSDNLPTLDENTITVSPFCGESDICPRDDSMQLFHINVANTSIELSKHNIYRIGRILFPPTPEILSNMCKQGFDDALRFLHRNNLINCTRCLSVQSTFQIQSTIDDGPEYDPECHECRLHRQEAMVSNLPDTVLTIFQEAIDSANKGLANWIFKHRGMKLLSVLSLPYTVPADVMMATFTKLLGAVPKISEKLWDISSYFVNQIKFVANKVTTSKERQEQAQNPRIIKSCTVDVEDSSSKESSPTQKPPPQARHFTRRSSLTVCRTGEYAVYNDTFDNIVQVTANHESIISYYYLDENSKKVKVTEIFDVTDSDSPVVQSQRERELNQQLEFDDDWEDTVWSTGREDYRQLEDEEDCTSGVEITPLDDVFDNDSSNIFSDPESEWTSMKTTGDEIGENLRFDDLRFEDLRPESDQPSPGEELLKRPYEVPAFTYTDPGV